MTATRWTLAAVCSGMLLGACETHEAEAPEAPKVEAEESAEPAEEMDPQPEQAPEAPTAPTAETLPIPEDFADEATSEVTAENYRDELAAMEKELAE